MKIAIIATICLLQVAATINASDELDNLIEVGRAQGDIAREAKEETENFKDVERAIERGNIEKGQSKEDIKDRYGEPVISFEKGANTKETWIFKPAHASFFDGPKIYLIFDDNGNLEETKAVTPSR